jgi:hypothetical protein
MRNFKQKTSVTGFRRRFAVRFAGVNADNWLLTGDFAFIDLFFFSLLA